MANEFNNDTYNPGGAAPLFNPADAWRMTLASFARVASLGRKNLKYAWRPYRHLRFAAQEIERAINDPAGGRLILNQPPQHGKSELISKWLPIWFLEWHPKADVVLASYNDEIATDWGRKIRDEFLENEMLTLRLNASSRAAGSWWLATGGGLVTAGIGGGLTGRPANLAIVDDPTKDWAEAHSEAHKKRLCDWYTTVLSTRLTNSGAIIINHTRWASDDLTGFLLSLPDAARWRVITLPAIAEEDDALGRNVGEPLCPELKSLDFLQAQKVTLGPHRFAAMYQQRPSPDSGNVWKRDWFRYWADERTLPEFSELIQSWDLTFGSTTKTASYVVGQVWGRAGGDYYLLDQVRDRMEFPQQIEAIKRLSFRYPRAYAKVIEEAANAKAAQQMLQHDISGMTLVKPSGPKDVRAQAVSAIIQAGNVYLPNPATHLWVDEFVEECITFPNGSHDDQVDAASQAIKYFADRPAEIFMCG